MKIALRFGRDVFRPCLTQRPFRFLLSALLGLGVLGLAATSSLGGEAGDDSTAIQTTHVIALALSQYAQDHGGNYPSGVSSTEVFQKLLDGKYVTDPATFYLLMPGKTPPVGSRLLPENVCYDMTAGVTAASPGSLPLVFVTGFRVEYQPNGNAVSLTRSFPVYAYSAEASMKWLTGGELSPVYGLAVAAKSGDARFLQGQIGRDGYGSVPNVLPTDFDGQGGAYRQLTPDGTLK